MKKHIALSLTILLLFAFAADAQETYSKSPLVKINRLTVYSTRLARTFGGLSKEPAKVEASITNLSGERVWKVEIQVDVIDSLRRTVKDRLFVTLDDPGLGDRSIAPTKTSSWHADIGDYKVPSNCDGGYGQAALGGDCLGNLQINRIFTKNNVLIWERAGWKDEPNPNKSN